MGMADLGISRTSLEAETGAVGDFTARNRLIFSDQIKDNGDVVILNFQKIRTGQTHAKERTDSIKWNWAARLDPLTLQFVCLF